MEITTDSLRENYRRMPTEELLFLHTVDGLTDEAKISLIAELKSRNIHDYEQKGQLEVKERKENDAALLARSQLIGSTVSELKNKYHLGLYIGSASVVAIGIVLYLFSDRQDIAEKQILFGLTVIAYLFVSNRLKYFIGSLWRKVLSPHHR